MNTETKIMQMIDKYQSSPTPNHRQRIEIEISYLIEWIRDQGLYSDTCTWRVLKEKCQHCRCHRSNVNTGEA